jgi:hypothetical protein
LPGMIPPSSRKTWIKGVVFRQDSGRNFRKNRRMDGSYGVSDRRLQGCQGFGQI